MSGENEQLILDDTLTDMAVNLVLGLMRSADTDVIHPFDWWPRAKTALVVSASIAESYASMISRFLEKIQVSAPTTETSKIVAETKNTLASLGDVWERFRFLCERDALYIVAMAQATKQLRRSDDGK